MFTELFCPDASLIVQEEVSHVSGQFFIVVANAEEIIDLTTKVKFHNYALACWFREYMSVVRNEDHRFDEGELQLGRYDLEKTVLAISPDCKRVHIVPLGSAIQGKIDEVFGKMYPVPPLEFESWSFKKVLKSTYKQLLRDFPELPRYDATVR